MRYSFTKDYVVSYEDGKSFIVITEKERKIKVELGSSYSAFCVYKIFNYGY